MGKNTILILGIIFVALLALAGTASADVPASSPNLTFNFDKIQVNGVYHGIPTLLPGDNYKYGYNYTFIPDGTYTLFGQVTNSGNVEEHVGISIIPDGSGSYGNWLELWVPAAGDKPTKVSWQYTLSSPDSNLKGWMGSWGSAGVYFDLDDVDVVNAAENEHTINQGPMSDMAVVFNNGQLSANPGIVYEINQSGDDYRALYTNGKIDFKSSPLYSFVE